VISSVIILLNSSSLQVRESKNQLGKDKALLSCRSNVWPDWLFVRKKLQRQFFGVHLASLDHQEEKFNAIGYTFLHDTQ